MLTETALLELVDLIYGAAGDPAKWVLVLEQLGNAIQAIAGTLHHQHNLSLESNHSTVWNLSSETIEQYVSYYGFRNPLMTTRPNIIQPGGVYHSQILCPGDAFTKSEYYNDYWKQHKLSHVAAVTLSKDDLASSNLSLFKSPGAEQFREEDLALLKFLAPHLQRAFQFHTRVLALETKAHAAEEILDGQPTAILLLDSRGNVVLINRKAKEVLAQEQTLRLTTKGLRVLCPAENKTLHALI